LLEGVDWTSIFVPLLGEDSCKAGVDKITFIILKLYAIIKIQNIRINNITKI
jgi:hypothetical protein